MGLVTGFIVQLASTKPLLGVTVGRCVALSVVLYNTVIEVGPDKLPFAPATKVTV